MKTDLLPNSILPETAVRRLIKAREIDLSMAPPPSGAEICLRAHYDGNGEFFTIVGFDVEYVDSVGRFTIGDLKLLPNVKDALKYPQAKKWTVIAERCSGPTLLLLDANASDWDSANAEDLYMMVANQILFRPGLEWDSAAARLGLGGDPEDPDRG